MYISHFPFASWEAPDQFDKSRKPHVLLVQHDLAMSNWGIRMTFWKNELGGFLSSSENLCEFKNKQYR